MSQNSLPENNPSSNAWQGRARQAWEFLSEQRRDDLLKTIAALPGDNRGWRGLIESVAEHVRFAAGDKSRVAIVGPANAGKSTLYNQLVRARKDHSEVSAVPGTTRQALTADAGLFSVVDTPGADVGGPLGEEERARAFTAAREADVLVVLFDALHGIRPPEQRLMREMIALGKPLVVALNKFDLVEKRERAQVLGRAAAELGLQSDELIPLSALHADGLERLLLAIASSEPQIVAALGAALPEYRWSLAHASIVRAASTSAAIALTPLPFLDFLPLVGVQAAMVLGVARVYDYKINATRARELIATFGIGMLGRTLFYELSKLGGPPGWAVSAAVAAGTTAALGYASALWFDRGEKLSRQALSKVAQVVSGEVIDRLKHIGRRRPEKESLREQVERALQNIPLKEAEKGELTSGSDQASETLEPSDEV